MSETPTELSETLDPLDPSIIFTIIGFIVVIRFALKCFFNLTKLLWRLAAFTLVIHITWKLSSIDSPMEIVVKMLQSTLSYQKCQQNE
jgi:hypothetical protein